MKPFLSIAAIALCCLLSSCQKEDSSEEDSSGSGSDYQPTSAGSEWNVHSNLAGTYKLVALGTDTLIDGAKFYKFDNSVFGRQYIGKSNGVYTSHSATVQSNQKITMVMLKDAPVGTAWTNTVSNQGTVSQYTFKIVSRDGEKTVNGKTYKDVIAVEYEGVMQDPMGGGTIKFTTGRTYTAKGVGAIAGSSKIDLMGFTMEDSTYLVSYTIK